MDSSDPLYEPEDTNETWISMVSSSAFLSKLWQMLNDPKGPDLHRLFCTPYWTYLPYYEHKTIVCETDKRIKNLLDGAQMVDQW